jgi:hypothetical protein
MGTNIGGRAVENRPSASQTIGAGAVAKADPDGYTILVAGSALAVVPSTIANLPFNVQSDLVAVGALANVPLVMVVQPAKGYKTIHDFVAAAKAKPDSMTYGSGGRGDATHLAAERFRLAAGFQGLYVPFRGAPEVLTEVMSGRLDFYMSPIPAAPQSSIIISVLQLSRPLPKHRCRSSLPLQKATWSGSGRYCSLIPGLGVKLSTTILAGPTVLSAVGACPPHDGVRCVGGSMLKARLKARSPFRAHAKHRAISPPPSSRQGRLFPPCRGTL